MSAASNLSHAPSGKIVPVSHHYANLPLETPGSNEKSPRREHCEPSDRTISSRPVPKSSKPILLSSTPPPQYSDTQNK